MDTATSAMNTSALLALNFLAVIFCLPLMAIADPVPSHDDLKAISQSTLNEIDTIEPPPFQGERPKYFTLKDKFPTPGDQGPHPTCAAWAVAYALRTFLYRQAGAPDSATTVFSPAFLHHQIAHSYDEPATLENALRALRDIGSLPTAYATFDDASFRGRDSRKAMKLASRYRIKAFHRLETLSNEAILVGIKDSLLAGRPVVIAAQIDEHFAAVHEHTVMSIEPVHAYIHAFVITGYSDEQEAFEVINSYGRQWNDSGFGWIGYDLFSTISPDSHFVIDD